MNWTPIIVEIDDIVECSSKPKWGTGIVLNVSFLGDIQFHDGTSVTYQMNTKGQRASVRFSDGRTRTILTPVNPLKKIVSE